MTQPQPEAPKPPKKRWWEKLVEKVGTAIGEAADKR
jgi:hypothetical protein